MAAIPEKYLDLIQKKAFLQLATLMPDGSPQVSPVWFEYDGTHILINSAKGRVKAMVLFQKIAEKEGIRVSQEEISARVVALAQSYDMPLQKFVKELEARNGFVDIHRELLDEKVINFLQEHAQIKDVEPAAAAAAS